MRLCPLEAVTGHYTRVYWRPSLWWMLAVGITDGPPPCARDHRAVVLSYPHLARRWAVVERRSAWLVVNTQVKACSRETHSLSATLLNTAHTVWLRCGASLSDDYGYNRADAAVIPTVSEMTYNVSSGTLNHTQPIIGS